MKNLTETASKLESFKAADYYHELKRVEGSLDLSRLKPVRIAMLRSYTAEMIEPFLKLRLLLNGYSPEFFWGDFNQYAQEILDNSSSLYAFKPDFVFLFVRIDELLPGFVTAFGEKRAPDWEDEIHHTFEHLVNLVDTVNSRARAQLIIQNMALTSPPYWGKYDAQQSDGQASLLFQLNRKLGKALESRPNAFIWDFAHLVMKLGYDNICDPKQWFLSRNPFKQSAYIKFADDISGYIMSSLGSIKKCIVLDLDNTLWGGIIGEDGMEGIALGYDYPGNCFVEFQKELLKLYHRGIILAINSKNNESDAFEVIDKHPYMVLRHKHFAAHRINWNDKATNLHSIAQELNIGLDSLVFIDDNAAECELVQQQCPECTVVQLPGKPHLIRGIVSTIPGIENIRLTEEDRQKGQIYRAQTERKQLEKNSADLDDFLKSLEMEVEIKHADKFTLPRISQLTLKTNQMNMTTRRYGEADIIEFTRSNNHFVFSISCKDRFGDNGIIGVCILRLDGTTCVIDTLLLSCRVIGRTIEQSIIAFVDGFARRKGAETIVGEFIPTEKNCPAKDTYKKHGFTQISDTRFLADLRKQELHYPPFIAHSLPDTSLESSHI